MTTDCVSEPQVIRIQLSEEERISGVPESKTIEDALAALHNDGIVVLENAVDTTHIDILNARMVSDALELLKLSTTHLNQYGTGNISQYPPVYKEFLFADIFANPIAATILNNILGPKPELRFIHSNTAVKGELRQPVHPDLNFDHLDFPFSLLTNIYLVDTTLENGATEIWLGTHRRGGNGIRVDEKDAPWIKQEYLDEQRVISPPIRPCIRKGSLVIRDLRLWHAGIPNQTDEPRILLNGVYYASWYCNPMRLVFPKSSEDRVKELSKDINIIAEYVPDEEFNPAAVEFYIDSKGGNGGEMRTVDFIKINDDASPYVAAANGLQPEGLDTM